MNPCLFCGNCWWCLIGDAGSAGEGAVVGACQRAQAAVLVLQRPLGPVACWSGSCCVLPGKRVLGCSRSCSSLWQLPFGNSEGAFRGVCQGDCGMWWLVVGLLS